MAGWNADTAAGFALRWESLTAKREEDPTLTRWVMSPKGDFIAEPTKLFKSQRSGNAQISAEYSGAASGKEGAHIPRELSAHMPRTRILCSNQPSDPAAAERVVGSWPHFGLCLRRSAQRNHLHTCAQSTQCSMAAFRQ
mmetsp:Transcript_52096/g.135113  ORF Transcript_52096/g.135113 Transcript_52096/m.135113 type:complete len:139 (+) Transcript_52096:847-1263(+)